MSDNHRETDNFVPNTEQYESIQASLVAQTVKNLSAMQETQVPSLVGKIPLEKGMATHSNIFAWRIPWKEEPGGLQPKGSQKVEHDWVTNTHAINHMFGRIIWQFVSISLKWFLPFKHLLEKKVPQNWSVIAQRYMDKRATTVHGVTESRTQQTDFHSLG